MKQWYVLLYVLLCTFEYIQLPETYLRIYNKPYMLTENQDVAQ